MNLKFNIGVQLMLNEDIGGGVMVLDGGSGDDF